ncbi:hypothetical protein [Deinococcus sp. Leaf326]|uniref:hypothetical protein n=1 Tax=Deinococcus sp. Leaf326 TaxID=1736338 RepID=UPI0006F769D3|nr:hypothetical protein [Deinococcus sp. Leaf326]KQR26995.1 hypothetical protein ASF71_18050 [Deinococcus sp. Leaf326]
MKISPPLLAALLGLLVAGFLLGAGSTAPSPAQWRTWRTGLDDPANLWWVTTPALVLVPLWIALALLTTPGRQEGEDPHWLGPLAVFLLLWGAGFLLGLLVHRAR